MSEQEAKTKEELKREEKAKNREKLKEENEKLNPPISIGLDIGTMNLVCARSDNENIKMTRNVFLKVDKENISINEMSNINYIENGEDIFIIGDDAFQFANIFGTSVARPMEKGLISPKELSAIDVLTLMLKELIGDISNKDVYVTYSIPASAIDENRSVTYHTKIFARILGSIGLNYSSLNEAMAIIYSECAKENYSGIAISFGAGMANISISFRGVEALTFSTARSGDWIDQQVASDLNMVPNRVTNIKEKYIDLSGNFNINNKKTKRVVEALFYYYQSMIDYTIKQIIKEFDEKVDMEIDDEIPIIISGGTSLPKGFVTLFKNVMDSKEIPFQISEIRRAKNPLTSVANGLLIKTMSDVKNILISKT